MTLSENYPLRGKTTINIGGVAKLFFAPKGLKELKEYLPRLGRDYPLHFLGGGSNTVFGSFKGVIVSSENLKGFEIIEETEKWLKISVLSGTPLKDLMPIFLKGNWCGFETLIGIPRITVGGAVAMNAGAYGKEIAPLVEKVLYVDPLTGELYGEKPPFGYRSSPFPQRGFIYKVLLKLPKCKGNFLQLLRNYNLRRRKSQPLSLPTAGSTFKNPKGHYAGRLLEEVGLKGFCTERGLCFSKKHANFMVNLSGNATFEDVLFLIETAKGRVLKEFGILLEEEVKLVHLW